MPLVVPLPTLVLQLDVLDRDGIAVGVEVGQGLIFRDPAAIDLIGQGQLAGLVVHLNDYVLAEVFE
jgi:hypothetical protein